MSISIKSVTIIRQPLNYTQSSRVGENKLPKSYRNQNKKQRHKVAQQAEAAVDEQCPEEEEEAEAETEQQPAKQPKLTPAPSATA